ncbi:hypothetical protein KAFR_0H01180 [Kazachstania africana CBS 2517]|uniref:Zinc-ribbon 15 domain-containing protein n=1 Tax=Kazachstania africana (strain ATCC 22294 / BCRC 22015 / CBS 2517 / CECT 1963 / NBRC 1671 / NRRL Y-8276) TaxID=1071382 RepID=H2AYX2_KAZAF|nr:hypothetical protein KAFR_0H01180 [Kazachstania africana CBS 2517]CCF59528.1 hypothetical protein KAFR_0H01180 [Kazachstania africana CBS 2517]
MFMFIPIICGVKNWDSPYNTDPRYTGLYCPNCHNLSVEPVKRREFFQIWFIPIVPIYWGKQIRCSICNWRQDFKTDEELNKVVNEQQHIKQNMNMHY